jgi:uncharacterized membrane protein YebE (DUF533 family)
MEPRRPTPQPSGEAGGALLKYGGLAILGALAYKAYANWQAEQAARGGSTGAGAQPLSPPGDTGFNPMRAGDPEALSDLLMTAMVAATQADGVVDAEEQRRILGKLDSVGMSGADREALARQLTQPVDPRDLVRAATTPETAAQVYAASALAVSVDTTAERRYLDSIAAALNIDPGLKAQLERAVART